MSDIELLKMAARAAGIAHVTPMMIEWGKWDPLNDGDDAHVATRRAIVLAAAQIGREMNNE